MQTLQRLRLQYSDPVDFARSRQNRLEKLKLVCFTDFATLIGLALAFSLILLNG